MPKPPVITKVKVWMHKETGAIVLTYGYQLLESNAYLAFKYHWVTRDFAYVGIL